MQVAATLVGPLVDGKDDGASALRQEVHTTEVERLARARGDRPRSGELDDDLERRLPGCRQEQIGHHPFAAVGRVERDLLADAVRSGLLLFDLRVERSLVVRELPQVLREYSVPNRPL